MGTAIRERTVSKAFNKAVEASTYTSRRSCSSSSTRASRSPHRRPPQKSTSRRPQASRLDVLAEYISKQFEGLDAHRKMLEFRSFSHLRWPRYAPYVLPKDMIIIVGRSHALLWHRRQGHYRRSMAPTATLWRCPADRRGDRADAAGPPTTHAPSLAGWPRPSRSASASCTRSPSSKRSSALTRSACFEERVGKGRRHHTDLSAAARCEVPGTVLV